MNRRVFAVNLTAAALAATAAPGPKRRDASLDDLKGFKRLWNGKDFSEFDIDTKSVWSIHTGAIVGSHKGQNYNEFLRTKKSYRNFELRGQLQLKNGFGNSGLQFRSAPLPGNAHEVIGYQADAGEKYWGCLYDESRRKKVLAGPPPDFLSSFNAAAWHLYIVRAQGNHITIEIDGVKTVDYTEKEPNIAQDGFIALQVHSNPKPVEVWFRDLLIKEL